jgi:hypothetical protein
MNLQVEKKPRDTYTGLTNSRDKGTIRPMTERVSPSKVQNIKQAQKNDRLNDEPEGQRTIAATAMLESQSEKYWQELVSQLRLQAATCKVAGIRIDLSVIRDKASDRETAVSIQAAAGFPSLDFAAIHLTYQSGAQTILVKKISGADLAGKIEPIPFAIGPTGKLWLCHGGNCQSPTAFSKAILRTLVDSLSRPPISVSEGQIEID